MCSLERYFGDVAIRYDIENLAVFAISFLQRPGADDPTAGRVVCH